ncbi:long-chain fatty acid--CoA ligase [Alicyclobacillus tolerans]|uniref:long-chain fatty acid--CoA ligase n=1 Tax=Alicyclobacillus tolerans TaxID=90970 RepID=UPI001F1BA809|nr:long-chain fatty acid--CoA ligase [Alicyclobacillus tolerans]MCF8565232.1 long-chain fatty acid--CoA ligase [Alicyclobacillus tolerans]
MNEKHFEFWPKRLPKSLLVPDTTIDDNLAVTARRYPARTAIYYYGTEVSYRRLWDEVNRIAGFLQQNLGVKKGDRVILYMQNSPQYMIGFYAILLAGGVVVPVNPMNITDEVMFYIQDCEAKTAVAGQELMERILPLLKVTPLENILVGAYSDYISPDADYTVPDVAKEPRRAFAEPGVVAWSEALLAGLDPSSVGAVSNDIAVMPYTSGTTGRPKGCVHTHKTVQANTVGAVLWSNITPSAVVLTTLPLFHVTGLIHSMSAPIYSGSTMVVMTRWNRDLAGELIERTGATHWTNIATMVVDFLANPNLSKYDLATLAAIGGGGAPLPQAVGEKLYELTSVRYAEGYGLSETISQTHFNPPDRPKLQCMGVPSFDVDARVVDPQSLRELGPGEEGEVIVSGPQVFQGYWHRDEDNQKAFVEFDGKRFFRTGDIAKYDEEGYFFIVDRVKRMINAAGFKVWPTEVESILYKHPDVEQACVIGIPDERRGETVKAFIVLRPSSEGQVQEQDIIDWAKGQMAAYKYPRVVEFVKDLPMSGSGKILWRKLQELELEKRNQAAQASTQKEA